MDIMEAYLEEFGNTDTKKTNEEITQTVETSTNCVEGNNEVKRQNIEKQSEELEEKSKKQNEEWHAKGLENLSTQTLIEFFTPSEKVLLEALLDPTNKLKTVTDLCKSLGISSGVYYAAMRKPYFLRELDAQVDALIQGHVAPAINALVREAQKGSYNHIKLLLELSGKYKDSKDVNVNISFEDTLFEAIEARKKPRIEAIDAKYIVIEEKPPNE